MKYSELDYDLLKREGNRDYVYDLVMSGIEDYSHKAPNDKTNPDFLVVLGCSPVPVKSRVLKLVELYKKGYGRYILLTGGKGWHRISQKSPEDRARMLKATRETISAKITGEERTEKQEDVLKKFDEKMRETLGESSYEGYRAHTEKKMLRYTEVQLMQKILYSLGEIPLLKIYHESFSNTTLENVLFSQKILQDLEERGEVPQINRIMLITSCFHCRRAILTFKKRFSENVEILACPGTWDLANATMEFTKEDLLSDKRGGYYRTQIYNELNAMINYSRNGSIADVDIQEVVGKKVAHQIEALHGYRNQETVEVSE